MFKRIIASLLFLSLLTTSPAIAETVVIDKFIGLVRSPSSDKIPDGAHDKFENVYVYHDNLEVVKGRQRLNSTAASDPVINGTYYYENAAGTTKKLVVAEATNVVVYDTDGTNRTVIKSGATNELHDFTQVSNTLYFTSTTDGLFKWAGSGSAAAVGSVAAPSTVDFSASTVTGGLTPGLPIGVTAALESDSSCAISPSTTATGCVSLVSKDDGGINVTADSGTLEQAGTSSTYSYKVTSFSAALGIESEASTVDTVSLKGDDVFTWSGTSCSACDPSSPYDTYNSNCCSSIQYVTAGQQTSTTGTLASVPSAPFTGYRLYRTVAGGSDYFLLGYQTTGTYTDGKPDASLGDPFDTTIDTITPPAFRYLESYKNILFTAEGVEVGFSHSPVNAGTDVDTYWQATDKITIDGRKPITGLHRSADSLLVFTENSIQELTGFGSDNFKLSNLAEGIGAVTDETIETDFQGDIIFFAGTRGVYKLRTFQQPQDDLTGATIKDNVRVSLIKISAPFLDPVFTGQDTGIVLSPSDYTTAHAYYDQDNNLYFLYIGQHCFVYDNVTSNWSYIPATKMKASVYRRSPNAVGQGVIWDDLGFVFDNWRTYSNGALSGTVTGTATASTGTTLSDSTATFNTTGDGLKGLWVYLDNESPEYRQITSNTATQITVSSAWTVNPITTDHYYIQYIKPEWKTKQYSPVKAPQSSRAVYFWIIANPTSQTQNLDIYSFENRDVNAINATTANLTKTVQVVNLAQKQIFKLNTPMNSSWIQWGFRAFVHNTSATVSPSVSINSYALEYQAIDER